MIRFERVAEPADFDRRARVPGNAWLADNPGGGRPKDYWTPFKGYLADGFRTLCAYSAMYEPVGTVDHFVSCDEDRSRAYEWQNYRYCAAWINTCALGKLHCDLVARDTLRIWRLFTRDNLGSHLGPAFRKEQDDNAAPRQP